MGNSAQHSYHHLYAMPMGYTAKILDISFQGLWQMHRDCDGPACKERAGQLWYDPQSVREFEVQESHLLDL